MHGKTKCVVLGRKSAVSQEEMIDVSRKGPCVCFSNSGRRSDISLGTQE